MPSRNLTSGWRRYVNPERLLLGNVPNDSNTACELSEKAGDIP